jgi:hypothetical protein
LTLSDQKTYEGFCQSLGAYFDNTNIQQQTFDQILRALDHVAYLLQYPETSHLILSPNSLTLVLRWQTISIELSEKAVKSVLTWPAKLVNPPQ